MKRRTPPDFELDRLQFRASIDYVKLAIQHGQRPPLPPLKGASKWMPSRSCTLLTVQEPTPNDIKVLSDSLNNAI
jgi:hypothetical protein